jgi:uncharacterized protein YqgV (UPF0045/DUF77 family)
MQHVMVELSMYPLAEGYRESISAFIQRLNSYSHISCTTNSTSTHVVGEYNAVFTVLATELARVHAEVGQTVFVAKFLSWDLMQAATDAG